MKYLIALVFIFYISINYLDAHEISAEDPHRETHFHDVEWKSCVSGQFCFFSIKELPPFFGDSLLVQIIERFMPRPREGKCQAERIFGKVILQKLKELFQDSKKIDLLDCTKSSSALVSCDVKIDGLSVREWLVDEFSLSYVPKNWCE